MVQGQKYLNFISSSVFLNLLSAPNCTPNLRQKKPMTKEEAMKKDSENQGIATKLAKEMAEEAKRTLPVSRMAVWAAMRARGYKGPPPCQDLRRFMEE